MAHNCAHVRLHVGQEISVPLASKCFSSVFLIPPPNPMLLFCIITCIQGYYHMKYIQYERKEG